MNNIKRNKAANLSAAIGMYEADGMYQIVITGCIANGKTFLCAASRDKPYIEAVYDSLLAKLNDHSLPSPLNEYNADTFELKGTVDLQWDAFNNSVVIPHEKLTLDNMVALFNALRPLMTVAPMSGLLFALRGLTTAELDRGYPKFMLSDFTNMEPHDEQFMLDIVDSTFVMNDNDPRPFVWFQDGELRVLNTNHFVGDVPAATKVVYDWAVS